eukprot:PhM_4_TR16126/c1_g3_i1/m.101270
MPERRVYRAPHAVALRLLGAQSQGRPPARMHVWGALREHAALPATPPQVAIQSQAPHARTPRGRRQRTPPTSRGLPREGHTHDHVCGPRKTTGARRDDIPHRGTACRVSRRAWPQDPPSAARTSPPAAPAVPGNKTPPRAARKSPPAAPAVPGNKSPPIPTAPIRSPPSRTAAPPSTPQQPNAAPPLGIDVDYPPLTSQEGRPTRTPRARSAAPAHDAHITVCPHTTNSCFVAQACQILQALSVVIVDPLLQELTSAPTPAAVDRCMEQHGAGRGQSYDLMEILAKLLAPPFVEAEDVAMMLGTCDGEYCIHEALPSADLSAIANRIFAREAITLGLQRSQPRRDADVNAVIPHSVVSAQGLTYRRTSESPQTLLRWRCRG